MPEQSEPKMPSDKPTDEAKRQEPQRYVYTRIGMQPTDCDSRYLPGWIKGGDYDALARECDALLDDKASLNRAYDALSDICAELRKDRHRFETERDTLNARVEELEERQRWIDNAPRPTHPDDERPWAAEMIRQGQARERAEAKLERVTQETRALPIKPSPERRADDPEDFWEGHDSGWRDAMTHIERAALADEETEG